MVAAELDRQVALFLARAVPADAQPASRSGVVDAIGSLGERDVRATAAVSAQMLRRPAAAIQALSGEGGSVAEQLEELRRLAEAAGDDHAVSPGRPQRRLMGLLQAADPLDDFLARWDRIDARTDAVVAELQESEQALRSDSAAMAQEQLALGTQVEALRRHAYMTAKIEEGLPAGTSPDVMYAVRQRRQDILTQLVIAMQGQAALAVVRENNHEFVRAIGAATNTTLAAVRTSRMVRQARVFERSLASGLREVGAITADPSELARLREAWARVDGTLAQVEAFRAQALESLTQTAGAIANEPGRSTSRG